MERMVLLDTIASLQETIQENFLELLMHQPEHQLLLSNPDFTPMRVTEDTIMLKLLHPPKDYHSAMEKMVLSDMTAFSLEIIQRN